MPKPLPITLKELETVVKEYGTPLQLYSEADIRDACRKLKSAFSKFPTFKEYYAVKALPNPSILTILKEEGCGMDCSSTGEIWVSNQLSITGEEIMYSSNYTSVHDLKKAVAANVIINLDDISLIDSLQAACKELNVPYPKLACFRVNPGLGNTGSETKSNLLGGPTAKFGVPLEDVVNAYKKAKSLGATRFGIHMMTGSCVMDTTYWAATVSKLLEMIVKIQKETGVDSFEFVNIGGGIGIPYRPKDLDVNLSEVSAIVYEEFTKSFGSNASLWPKLFMENGRFLTGPYGWLISQCHAIKHAFGINFYGLDATMANLMRPGMYGAYHHITVPQASARDSNNTQIANVVGTLCENNDWFASKRELPANIHLGDLFVIHDTGAHSHSMGFQYNAKLRAPEVLITSSAASGSTRFCLIREREVIEDLFRNTLIAPHLQSSVNNVARVVPRNNEKKSVFDNKMKKNNLLIVGTIVASILCLTAYNRLKL